MRPPRQSIGDQAALLNKFEPHTRAQETKRTERQGIVLSAKPHVLDVLSRRE